MSAGTTASGEEFGKDFNLNSLPKMRAAYQCFPIRDAVRTVLSWTPYQPDYMDFLPTEDELQAELMRENQLLNKDQPC